MPNCLPAIRQIVTRDLDAGVAALFVVDLSPKKYILACRREKFKQVNYVAYKPLYTFTTGFSFSLSSALRCTRLCPQETQSEKENKKKIQITTVGSKKVTTLFVNSTIQFYY